MNESIATMCQSVLIKQYNSNSITPINYKELWRYAGFNDGSITMNKELTSQMDEVINNAKSNIIYKVAYLCTNKILFSHNSNDLNNLLNNCQKYYMFAATIGFFIDKQITIYTKTQPTKALFYQALGTERIESLCDKFCQDIKWKEQKNNNNITIRVSPGYGDFSIKLQKHFFDLLDCNRKLGISLNKSYLISPSKSVTAIFGVTDNLSNSQEKLCRQKCNLCKNINCNYRKN